MVIPFSHSLHMLRKQTPSLVTRSKKIFNAYVIPLCGANPKGTIEKGEHSKGAVNSLNCTQGYNPSRKASSQDPFGIPNTVIPKYSVYASSLEDGVLEYYPHSVQYCKFFTYSAALLILA